MSKNDCAIGPGPEYEKIARAGKPLDPRCTDGHIWLVLDMNIEFRVLRDLKPHWFIWGCHVCGINVFKSY